jgi:ceramide glucosyltransferase
MNLSYIPLVILGLAAIPFIYYFLVLYSSWRFFSIARQPRSRNTGFTPPVSCLKPIRGLDVEAYENYASFCRQDYPQYEIVFCAEPGDPALPVIEQLIHDFPERRIRVLLGSGRTAVNDKVAKLVRLTNEAEYDLFAISDGDVRVGPDYLRSVVAPFQDPKVGAATCMYSTAETTFLEKLQSVSMTSDFFAGILVAWQIDGVKFALAQTIVTTRQNIESFGGYQILESRPADDLYIGRLTDEQGLEVKLLPYVVHTVADFQSLSDLLKKRIRWMTVMRHMRPWGHLGLIFTWGLPWALLAVAVHPTLAVAAAYLGGYLAFRASMTWLIGGWGMKQSRLWKRLPLIPVWDGMAFAIWLSSFACKTIRWRGVDYNLRGGRLSAVTVSSSGPAAADTENTAGA